MAGATQLRTRVIEVPKPIDVLSVRTKLGVSQSEFAARYGFSLRTLLSRTGSRAALRPTAPCGPT